MIHHPSSRDQPIAVDLHNRTLVHLLAVHEPEENTKQHYAAKYNDAPVHCRTRDLRRGWPKGEENANYAVDHGNDVDGETEAA